MLSCIMKKTMGRNKTIRQRGAILYGAGQREEKRMESLYVCARGKRPNQLDAIEQEITEELNRHPARSVPEVVAMLKETFGICVTETPVRIWLKKRGIRTEKQKQYQQKQMKKSRNIL